MEKPIPGCLGRMVGLFDLSNDVSGNKLLTDNPQREASLARSRSNAATVPTANSLYLAEDKMVASELHKSSSKKKMNVTPMKTLLTREMSKEAESKHIPSNIVAKLMGLDPLPHQQSNTTEKRCLPKHCSRFSLSHSDIPVECWEQDRCFVNKKMHHEDHQCGEQSECEDVYGICQQWHRTNSRDFVPHKRRYNEDASANRKRMALVQQKFREAKCLATNQMNLQSKEFQDALDVLSSNKDLFLKFLQEPNTLFSQHLQEMRSVAPPPETKRITVLRPSNVVHDEKSIASRKKSDKQKEPAQIDQPAGHNKNIPQPFPFANQRVNSCAAQSTHIVVLKPSPGKTHDSKALMSPPSTSPRILHGGEFCYEPDEYDNWESREVAKEITRRIRENLMADPTDETLHSSTFSNGHMGDGISFYKPDNDYALGNLSDVENMSPNSRHAWDFSNRFCSPYSSSSFSCGSCSPESYVCREAKKRLSERWAMVTSPSGYQEQTHRGRSSSTLGEMLALSDSKKPMRSNAFNKGQESVESTSCSTSNFHEEEDMVVSPKNLLRSKSLPVMPTVYTGGLTADVSEFPKEPTRAESSKSSSRGKASSLLFSLNMKTKTEQFGGSQLRSEFQTAPSEPAISPELLSRKIGDDLCQCTDRRDTVCSLHNHGPLSQPALKLPGSRAKQTVISPEGGFLVPNAKSHGSLNENQDQPSPVSVLEDPFKEDMNTIPETSRNSRAGCVGHNGILGCNLIAKSPPIGSVARTLSVADSFAEAATSFPPKTSAVSSSPRYGEHEWLCSVQAILSEAGLDGPDNCEFPFIRWHSLESPLEQSLREKLANSNLEELLLESNRREAVSHYKLVFDCVNAALMEITGHLVVEGLSSSMLVDLVWARIKDWFIGEVRCSYSDDDDMDILIVERVVRNEVASNSSFNMRSEFNYVGMEIEGKLMEDLVQELVVDFSCRV